MTRTRRLLATAAAVALIVVGCTVAYAAIPASDGTITACRRLSGGQAGTLRVIDAEAGQQCASGEAELSWNQTGPQGPPGADGMLGRQVVTRTVTQTVEGPFRFDNGDIGTQLFDLDCPQGTQVVASGWHTRYRPGGGLATVAADHPLDGDTWRFGVIGRNNPADPNTVDLYAVCVATPAR